MKFYIETQDNYVCVNGEHCFACFGKTNSEVSFVSQIGG